MKIKFTRAALTVLILAALQPGLPAQQSERSQAMPAGFQEYTSDGAFFTAQVPVDWDKSESISEGRLNREFGVSLKGPKSKDGAYLRITLLYYAPDHARFKTVEKYLRLNSRPDPLLTIKGETYSRVSAIVVAHRPAKQFERRTFDFIPPYGVDPKKVPVYEYRVVFPGKKEGIYVLIYHAPEDLKKENLAVFKKIMASFKPAR
ncbi:MAG: hypothetical protein PHV36_11990 [Elusimicrobiales bacterium]|nr:hypothetical protein [Elusimicrobiales bacterium]